MRSWVLGVVGSWGLGVVLISGAICVIAPEGRTMLAVGKGVCFLALKGRNMFW